MRWMVLAIAGCVACGPAAEAGLGVRIEASENPVLGDEVTIRVDAPRPLTITDGELQLDGCTAATFTGALPSAFTLALRDVGDGEHRVALVVRTPLGRLHAEIRLEVRRGRLPAAAPTGCA